MIAAFKTLHHRVKCHSDTAKRRGGKSDDEWSRGIEVLNCSNIPKGKLQVLRRCGNL